MEAFIQAGYRGEKLASLNWWRTILKVTTLLDIATGDGKKIIKATLSGKSTGRPNLLHWAYQGQVSKKQW
eukprot:2181432-Ditylum_brightwellii.AAC.1